MPDQEHPDLLPSADGINQLGLPDNRWDKAYVNTLSDGTRTVAVEDLATTDQIGPAVVRALPVIEPITDEGKILMVRNGHWSIESYPSGALPPLTADDEGKVLQVDDGKWALKRAMVLPPVDGTMDGCILRVVAGQFVAVRHDDDAAQPCPIAPAEDDHILISFDNAWTTVKLTEKLSVPPIGAPDLGKFLTVVEDTENGGWKLSYTRPPVVTETTAGALPPLPGDAKQFFNGAGGWSAVTAGNNGHWRVGDYKMSVRPSEPGWVACDGMSIGAVGSGAAYFGDEYKALYAVMDGTLTWETNWDNLTPQFLPLREFYKLRYAPDAQAPAEVSVLYDAAAGDPSHFQAEFCRDLGFAGGVVAVDSGSGAGWYRLGGDVPVLMGGSGETFAGPEGVFLDASEVFNAGAGLWYYRIRQLVGPYAAPIWTSRWTYGSVLANSA
ncbi:MAG: hypothetical protein LBT97_02985 [Planctomycetota bacterium]|jgi:hypothetical protein|nr:hypothetical protein [Planctomycetota bacterium]